MSFSVLEAMAAGMTVVAGKCQGNELVIKENINGLLVDTNSEKSLIDAVIVLISDADKRSRLARAARETIRQDFDLTHTLNQYSDLLKKFAHV
jgi:glycosyltransferase involved in cell wall biosynthesis